MIVAASFLSVCSAWVFAEEPPLSRQGTPCFGWPQRMLLHGPLTSDALVQFRWELGSWIFNAYSYDGFPIRFFQDGRVETKNLALVTKWRLDPTDRLELLHDNQRVAYVFTYDASCGALVSAPANDPESERLHRPHIEIILAR